MILERRRSQNRQHKAGQLPLVFHADDVVLDEQDAVQLVVRRGLGDMPAQRFLRHQALGAQGKGRDQVFVTQILAHAHHQPVGDAA